MPNMLVCSGGFLNDYIPIIDETLAKHQVKSILFVPYAQATKEEQDVEIERHRKFFDKFMTHKTEMISLHQCENKEEAIAQAESFFVCGGNTYALLKSLYDLNLIEALRKKILDNTLFIGVSAGANIVGKTIQTSNDMVIVNEPKVEALHILPFNINPHYPLSDGGDMAIESRKERIEEFLTINEQAVVALPEGGLIHVEGETLTIKGKKALVFRKNEEIKIIEEKEILKL